MCDVNKASSSGMRFIKIKGVPKPIRLDQLKIINKDRSDIFTKSLKLQQSLGFKEETIYESCDGDFLSGEYEKVCLVNKLNLTNNSCLTSAKFVRRGGEYFEKDSQEITTIIGQKNYDVLFFALCSIINTEMKVRAMIALLTKRKNYNTVSCQPDDDDITKNNSEIIFQENLEKTDEKSQKKRRIKRKATPYVVQTEKPEYNPNKIKKIKKIIITDPSIVKTNNLNSPPVTDQNGVLENVTTDVICASSHGKDLVDLKEELRGGLNDDSDSNHSDGNLSIGSLRSMDLSEGAIKNIYHRIDNMTQKESFQPNVDKQNTIVLLDGTTLNLYAKPEDQFHLITPETLYNLTKEEKQKLLQLQAVIDFKLCQTRNEHDNMPLHEAVLHGDEDLVRRQCVVLKGRDVSVDISANGLTPLQMSVRQGNNPKCTALLLQHGADVLLTDSEQKSILHIAAEAPVGHLKEIIQFCRLNARHILEMEGDVDQSKLKNKSDELVANILFLKMCSKCDDQGYTPLMLAAKVGNIEHVKELLRIAPSVIDMPMPNSGNTALYITVSAACIDAIECGNRSKVRQNFEETIGLLVEKGADPDFRNHSGSNISELLTEFNMTDLSSRIANTLMMKFSDGTVPFVKNYDSYMLLKDSMGTVKVEEIDKPKSIASDARILEKVPVTNAVTRVTRACDPPQTGHPKNCDSHMLQKDSMGAVKVEQIDKPRSVTSDVRILENVPVTNAVTRVTRPFDSPQTGHPKNFVLLAKKSPDLSIVKTETSTTKECVKENGTDAEKMTKYVIKRISVPKVCRGQKSLCVGSVASDENSASAVKVKRKPTEQNSPSTVKKKKG